MTGNLRHINNVNNINRAMEQQKISNRDIRASKEKAVKLDDESLPLVHESCNFSTFSLVTAVGGLLTFAGIILYALLV